MKKALLRACTLASSLLVAACGGGGGGSSPTPPAPTLQPVAVSETNAKPVSAHALDTAQNLSATEGSGLITGVQVQPAATAGAGGTLLVAQAIQAALGYLPAGPAVATGVTINQTSACALGGTITISGNVASGAGLVAGDSVTISAAGCKTTVNGATSTMSGTIALVVAGGSITGAIPYHVILATTVTNLSVQTGTTTVTASGDARIDINVTSASVETLSASGAAIASRSTTATSSRSTTLRNYTQTVAISGSTVTNTVSASVESDSPLLGAGGGSYSLSTPTPVTWDATTRSIASGSVRVVGASNSQVLATVGAGGAVTLQLDANGDGTFEKTVPTTVTELRSLL